MSIKLVAIDMDGTLLNDQNEIPSINKQAIAAASAKGVNVVLCTGRPLAGVRNYVKQLDLQNDEEFIATYNGGLVQTLDNKIIIQHQLNYQDYLDAEKLGRQLDVHFHAHGTKHLYTSNKNISPYTVEESFLVSTPLRYRSVAEMNPEISIPKMMYIDDPEKLAQAKPAIEAAFGDRFNIVQSMPYFLELLPPHVSKGAAIQELAEYLAVKPDEVMAIGDQGNDISMIQVAGTGVAMANAIPALKELAQYVTDTNNNAGVGQAIQKFVL